MSEIDRMRVGAVKTLLEEGWIWDEGRWVQRANLITSIRASNGLESMDPDALRVLAHAHTLTESRHPDGFLVRLDASFIGDGKRYIAAWREVRRVLGVK